MDHVTPVHQHFEMLPKDSWQLLAFRWHVNHWTNCTYETNWINLSTRWFHLTALCLLSLLYQEHSFLLFVLLRKLFNSNLLVLHDWPMQSIKLCWLRELPSKAGKTQDLDSRRISKIRWGLSPSVDQSWCKSNLAAYGRGHSGRAVESRCPVLIRTGTFTQSSSRSLIEPVPYLF